MPWLLMLLVWGLGVSGLGACGDPAPSGPAAAPPLDRKSVLLITLDTLRADHLSSYGFHRETTPHIDQLASEGVLFERAVAAATRTAPSHASILTSHFVREHSIGHLNGATRLEGSRTLAEVFTDAGYATAAFVSNGVLRHEIGLDRGFDRYDDEFNTTESNRADMFERLASDTTERAVAWLAREQGPFFLWVHYQEPHGPYEPPGEFAERFPPEGAPDEPRLRLLQDNSGAGGVPRYQVLPGLHRASEYRARYAGEIGYTDQWVEKLLAAVAERDPIVLLTSDHGESLGEDGHYFVHGTTTLPQEALVPMVIRAPALAAGRRRDVVSHVDVMPTLLELAGLAPPEGVSGLALGPFLRSGEPLPERLVYCDLGHELSAYGPERIVRVAPASDPWREQEGERTWLTYSWDDAEPVPLDGAESALREAILGYATDARGLVQSPVLAPHYTRMLRSLGYID